MAINLPSSVFEKLNEAILLFNRTCTLVYPDKEAACANCYTNTLGGRSVNFYRAGGPIAFNRGVLCPLCGGEGVKITENTEDIELRVYYNRRDWLDVGWQVDIPQGIIQTVGYMSEYPKIVKAKELLVPVGKYDAGRYKRLSKPFSQGFKQNPTQYIVIFWERV